MGQNSSYSPGFIANWKVEEEFLEMLSRFSSQADSIKNFCANANSRLKETRQILVKQRLNLTSFQQKVLNKI